MLDAYIFGKVERISPEAPVPVVDVKNYDYRLGGAANVALNLKALGAEPMLIAVTGDDEPARRLESILVTNGLSTKGIFRSPSRITTVKNRVIGNNVQMLRIDSERTDGLNEEDKTRFLYKVRELLNQCDALIFEDYDKGLLDDKSIREIIAICKQANIPTIVDPKNRNFSSYVGATLFKPNLKEIKEGLNTDLNLSDMANLKSAVEKLKELLKNDFVMVTLSEKGIYITNHHDEYHETAHLRNIADVSGAGDTVVSVAALALACNLPMNLIASLANLAGGLVCEKVGVVPIDADTLKNEAMKTLNKA